MKVKELLAKLRDLDEELDVLCYTEDEALLPKGHIFRLLGVVGVDVTEGERRRGDDGIATLKLGAGTHSEKLAMIDITSDF